MAVASPLYLKKKFSHCPGLVDHCTMTRLIEHREGIFPVPFFMSRLWVSSDFTCNADMMIGADEHSK
jgi:hypothetical protein